MQKAHEMSGSLRVSIALMGQRHDIPIGQLPAGQWPEGFAAFKHRPIDRRTLMLQYGALDPAPARNAGFCSTVFRVCGEAAKLIPLPFHAGVKRLERASDQLKKEKQAGLSQDQAGQCQCGILT
ncbi:MULTISPECIES: hypothetical protein [unclassified Pseudomonas]|uniref:hypothetical protein n=1 Tax=unclassified Pseudomonas TaxID=196821 RepID=UPI001314B386